MTKELRTYGENQQLVCHVPSGGCAKKITPMPSGHKLIRISWDDFFWWCCKDILALIVTKVNHEAWLGKHSTTSCNLILACKAATLMSWFICIQPGHNATKLEIFLKATNPMSWDHLGTLEAPSQLVANHIMQQTPMSWELENNPQRKILWQWNVLESNKSYVICLLTICHKTD